MNFRLIFKPKAEQDIGEGRDYYSQIRAKLGTDFLTEIDQCVKLILANPFRRAEVFKSIRQVHLHRFPYMMSYLIENDSIIVIAVTHNRRHSRLWKSRLP